MLPMGRGVLGFTGIVTVAATLTACKFPPPPDVLDEDAAVAIDAPIGIDAPPPTYTVGGTINGLWSGASITLHLAAGNVVEDVAATAGEPFMFDARLLDTTSWLVTVIDDGPDHDCVVDNGSGSIHSANVGDLHVTCTNLVPHSIALSIPTTFTFDPRVTRYMLPVSLLQQETTVLVTGPTLTGADVNGVAVTIGQASGAIAIGQDPTTIPVVVRKGTISQRYELVLDRGATPIVEASYARASNAGLLDRFGVAAAADGDYLAVGAIGEDSSTPNVNDDTVSNAGAVYVYRRSGTTWSPTQMLKGSAVTTERFFGNAIDMDGDLMVVGAPYDDGRAQNAGAAYVFRLDRAAGRWNEEQRLTATDAHADDRFGTGVGVSANRIVIDAPSHDGGQAASTNYGLVYVFTKVGAAWTEEARVRATAMQAGDNFGSTIAIDADTLVAWSARGLMVKRRSGVTWADETLTAPRGDFALQGDLLAVGDPGDASGNGQPGDQSAPGSGAIRVYTRNGAAWSETAYLKAAVPQANAAVGLSVALVDNTIVTCSQTPPALLTFEHIGGSWVVGNTTPASGPPTIATNWGEQIAASRYGAVATSSLDDGVGAGTAPSSGTAWFFR